MDVLRSKMADEVQLMKELEKLKDEIQAEQTLYMKIKDELNAMLQEGTREEEALKEEMRAFESAEHIHAALTKQVGPLRREYLERMEAAQMVERRQAEADENLRRWETEKTTRLQGAESALRSLECPTNIQHELDEMRRENEALRTILGRSTEGRRILVAEEAELEETNAELAAIDEQLRMQRYRNSELERRMSEQNSEVSSRLSPRLFKVNRSATRPSHASLDTANEPMHDSSLRATTAFETRPSPSDHGGTSKLRTRWANGSMHDSSLRTTTTVFETRPSLSDHGGTSKLRGSSPTASPRLPAGSQRDRRGKTMEGHQYRPDSTASRADTTGRMERATFARLYGLDRTSSNSPAARSSQWARSPVPRHVAISAATSSKRDARVLRSSPVLRAPNPTRLPKHPRM